MSKKSSIFAIIVAEVARRLFQQFRDKVILAKFEFLNEVICVDNVLSLLLSDSDLRCSEENEK